MKPNVAFSSRIFRSVTLFVLGVAAAIGLHAADEAEPWKWQYQRVPLVGFDLDQAEVVRVTSLASEGKGTLREALWKKGPRLIVFEVGGVIDLVGKELGLGEPQAVIAGQTAPSPGITIIRGGLRISGSQVLVQHIRVRPGDMGKAKGSGWTPDGNIVLFGIDSRKDSAIFDGVAEAYFKANVGYDRDGKNIAELRKPFDTLAQPPLWPEGLQPMGEAQTLWHIARFVGARPGERDATDARIVAQALSGTARIIDSQDDVEGYPNLEPPVVRPLEVPDADRINWLNGLSAEVGVPDLRPRD